MIRSTLQGARSKNNVTSIFVKILLNHIQLILLTASFNFKWPALVLDLFDVAKPVAQVSTQILSFDCFLDSRKNITTTTAIDDSSAQSGVRIFF